LIKVERAEDADIGADQEVGGAVPELGGDDGAAHDVERGVHALPRARDVGALGGRNAQDVDGDDVIGNPAQPVERQRIGGAAID